MRIQQFRDAVEGMEEGRKNRFAAWTFGSDASPNSLESKTRI
jgi:hypothetical protein